MSNNGRYNSHSHGSGKKPYYKRGMQINYVKKSEVNVESPEKHEEVVNASSAPEKHMGISREIITARYRKDLVCKGLISDWIIKNPDIYSSEIISPEFTKDFKLPLTDAIISPRKSSKNYYEDPDFPENGPPSDPKYQPNPINTNYNQYYAENYEDEDTGIVEGAQENIGGHHKIRGMPAWVNEPITGYNTDKYNENSDTLLENTKNNDIFGMGNRSLEDEKRAFLKQNIKPDSSIHEIEESYSKIDEIFEQKMKQNTKIDDIFNAKPMDEKAVISGITAIDLNTIESNLLKKTQPELTNPEGDENDDGTNLNIATSSVPAWGAYSAEEIQKQSIEHMDNWGMDNIRIIENNKISHNIQPEKYQPEINETMPNFIRPPQYQNINDLFMPTQQIIRTTSPPPPPPPGLENPFCPSYMRISENEPAWFYKDLQGILRGPFTPLDMYHWLIAEYFPLTLEIRFKENAPFIKLGAYLDLQRKAPIPPPMPIVSRPKLEPEKVQQPKIKTVEKTPEYTEKPTVSKLVTITQPIVPPQPIQPKVEFADHDFPELKPKVESKESVSQPIKTNVADKKSNKKSTKEALAKNVLGFF